MVPNMKLPGFNSTLAAVLLATATFHSPSASAQARYTIVDLTPAGTSAAGVSTVVAEQSGTVGGFPGGVLAPTNHAFLWPDGSAPVDLHPPFVDLPEINGFGNSFALATDGAQQVGYGVGPGTFRGNVGQASVALRWSGTADSVEILQPPFSDLESKALGTCNGQAVGYGVTSVTTNGRGVVRITGGPTHAVLWNANGVGVDLNNGATSTVALACDGNRQVGFGGTFDISTPVTDVKAMMWFGNRSNFVWLHPSKYFSSQAVAISGVNQVGHAEVLLSTVRGQAFVRSRAILWSGSAASAVELQAPSADLVNYYATGVNSGHVVGYGTGNGPTGTFSKALYWADATSPAVDLTQFLPAGFTSAVANGIDASGRIIGTAWNDSGTATQRDASEHAIMWVPVQ
jgi:hypothetical protein